MRHRILARIASFLVMLGLIAGVGLIGASPAAASDGASISGTVTFDGAPLESWVYLFGSTGLSGQTEADANGQYSFSDLDFGPYTLSIYEQGWHPGLQVSVEIDASNLNPIIDLPVPSWPTGVASVSGTYTDGASGLAQAGAMVTFYGIGQAQSASTTTDANGRYEFTGLPSGKFSLAAQAVGLPTEWIDVVVEPGEDLVANIVNEVLTGVISGQLLDAQGDPVEESLYVQVNGATYSAALSDATGQYTIENLRAGAHTLFAGGTGTTWLRSASPVNVTSGATTVVNLVLEPKLPSSISGTVRNSAGDPVQSICVSAPSPDGSNYVGALSDEAGNYTVPELEPGPHTLWFQDCSNLRFPNYAPEYWGGGSLLDDATFFSLAPGAELTGRDAVIDLGGTISGTVDLQVPEGGFAQFGPGFSPQREIYRLEGGNWVRYDYFSPFYGPGGPGEYRLSGLPQGSYRIGFVDAFDVLPVDPLYWNGAATLDAAQSIQITGSEHFTGVDGRLQIPRPNGEPAPLEETALTPSRERPQLSQAGAAAGQAIAISGGTDLVGRWISAWVYPAAGGSAVPMNIDSWQQVGPSGQVVVTLPAAIPAGSHRLALQSSEGRSLGWRSLSISGAPIEPAVTAELGTTNGAGIPSPITIRVAGSAAPTATGTVQLSYSTMGGPLQTAIATLDATGAASFAVPSDLASGQYDVSASYSGDAAYLAATRFNLAQFTVSQQGQDESFAPIVGVGAISTEDLMAGLSVLVTEGMDGPLIGSYAGSPGLTSSGALVRTRDGGRQFTRPSTSVQGVVALSQSATGGSIGGVPIGGYVDFARSVTGPSAEHPGTDLTFIPFAEDSLSYAVLSADNFPRDIALGAPSQDALSPAPFTLRNIYRGTVTSYVDADFNQVTIRPVLPVYGTDTRIWWLASLGLTEETVGAPVVDMLWPENDGTSLSQIGDIVPFSVSKWIAQGNHSSLPTAVLERRSLVELGSIDTVQPLVAGVGGGRANPDFPISRTVFTVVETARLSGTSQDDLRIQSIFEGSTSRICSSQATLVAYGYSTIGALCGNTSLYRQGYRLS